MLVQRKFFVRTEQVSKDAKAREMMVNHGTKRHYAAPSKPSRRQIGLDIEHTEHSIMAIKLQPQRMTLSIGSKCYAFFWAVFVPRLVIVLLTH